MIKKPTTLILGAGASAPYKYPTGKLLRNIILNTTLNTNSFRFYTACGFEDIHVKKFIEALKKSSVPSIDYFLEYRSEFIDVGKLAISNALIQFENSENLYEIDNWYQYLFNKLTENASFDSFTENNLRIITFNYDRSLEFFLINALQNLYNKTEIECWEKLKKIPIVHVHGQIGFLPYQENSQTRQYTMSHDPSIVKESSSLIKIISEKELINNRVFECAHELILQAEKIYFLGFGYHYVNLKRLKISSLQGHNQEILGTSYGLTSKEKEEIEIASGKTINLFPENSTNDFEVLDFLRHYVSFE